MGNYNIKLIKLVCVILRQLMATKQLLISVADGLMKNIKPGRTKPQVAVRLDHRCCFWRLRLWHDLAVGESYRDGDLQI